jgi:protein-S-isoprenylcysteine O-methyltransferase Ste14
MKKAGIQYVLRYSISVLLQMGIFFLAAGRMDIERAWIYFGVLIVNTIFAIVTLIRCNPELLEERLIKRQNTKKWDKVLLPIYVITGVFMVPLIMGLDVGRFRLSSLPFYYIYISGLFFVFSLFFGLWAMVVNRHFEVTVRIQEERHHGVISSGPYGVVRHPGYVAGIIAAIAAPLMVGSLYALIPGGIAAVILIIRTLLEDNTLKKELTGYADYALKVRFRLFPGIW